MLVETLIAFDVLLLLFRFCHNLCTALADRWLESVSVFLRRGDWLFARLELLLSLFYRFLVIGISPAVRNRSWGLASLLQNPLAVRTGARNELAFFLDLALDLSLFVIDELLLALQVLRHPLLDRLQPFAHLLGLPAHRFRLESTPLSLIDDLFFLQAHNFLA